MKKIFITLFYLLILSYVNLNAKSNDKFIFNLEYILMKGSYKNHSLKKIFKIDSKINLSVKKNSIFETLKNMCANNINTQFFNKRILLSYVEGPYIDKYSRFDFNGITMKEFIDTLNFNKFLIFKFFKCNENYYFFFKHEQPILVSETITPVFNVKKIMEKISSKDSHKVNLNNYLEQFGIRRRNDKFFTVDFFKNYSFISDPNKSFNDVIIIKASKENSCEALKVMHILDFLNKGINIVKLEKNQKL
ncbi:hypothetical protein AAEX28_15490 [Lentisphaerota bacterium WC36G]|nr:hypothetical protein LJT99_02245 [Lentisphaerae bacterium WC36]